MTPESIDQKAEREAREIVKASRHQSISATGDKYEPINKLIENLHKNIFFDLLKREKEIEKLKQALSGRTVSCEACNGMAKENDDLKRRVEGHLADLVIKIEENKQLTALCGKLVTACRACQFSFNYHRDFFKEVLSEGQFEAFERYQNEASTALAEAERMMK